MVQAYSQILSGKDLLFGSLAAQVQRNWGHGSCHYSQVEIPENQFSMGLFPVIRIVQ